MTAAERVGARLRREFVATAREEAAAGGERFTGAFLLACFAEAVGGMRDALAVVGMASRAEEWREAERGRKSDVAKGGVA